MLECAQLLEIVPSSAGHVARDGARGRREDDGEIHAQKRHLGSGDALRSCDVVFLVGSIITSNRDPFQ